MEHYPNMCSRVFLPSFKYRRIILTIIIYFQFRHVKYISADMVNMVPYLGCHYQFSLYHSHFEFVDFVLSYLFYATILFVSSIFLIQLVKLSINFIILSITSLLSLSLFLLSLFSISSSVRLQPGSSLKL